MNVAICITTYRRASMLRNTLQSLERLAFSKAQPPAISVIVIDNDWHCSAINVLSEFTAYPHRLQYRVEANPSVSYARNAALDLAQTADFVAFLDDDEEATPYWLDELLTVQAAFQAPIVAGPIVPSFDKEPASWLSEGSFHQRKRYVTGTVVSSTSAGNCLLSRAVAFATRPGWFDPDFARSGGEDTHFFRRCADLGFPIRWADDAIVYEHVPENRTDPKYLIARARDGGNHWTRTEITLHPQPARLALRAAAGAFRIVQGCACAVIAPFLTPAQRLRGRMRLAEGLGNFDAFLGRKYTSYRPEADDAKRTA